MQTGGTCAAIAHHECRGTDAKIGTASADLGICTDVAGGRGSDPRRMTPRPIHFPVAALATIMLLVLAIALLVTM